MLIYNIREATERVVLRPMQAGLFLYSKISSFEQQSHYFEVKYKYGVINDDDGLPKVFDKAAIYGCE